MLSCQCPERNCARLVLKTEVSRVSLCCVGSCGTGLQRSLVQSGVGPIFEPDSVFCRLRERRTAAIPRGC